MLTSAFEVHRILQSCFIYFWPDRPASESEDIVNYILCRWYLRENFTHFVGRKWTNQQNPALVYVTLGLDSMEHLPKKEALQFYSWRHKRSLK